MGKTNKVAYEFPGGEDRSLAARIAELEAQLEEARKHKCDCGIPRDPNELCEARCHILNLLPEDPRENTGLSTVELVQKLATRRDELEAANVALEAERDRLRVECEAWRSWDLQHGFDRAYVVNVCDDISHHDTIDSAVDALMAEKGEA